MAEKTLKLSALHLDSISKHGEATYPNECCGILLGRVRNGEKILEELYPVENSKEQTAQPKRFLIRPDQLKKGEVYAHEKHLEVLGFYHSHPEAEARPSIYDLEHAWPFYSYIIVSVKGRHAGEVNSWRLTDDRSHFDREHLICLD